MRHRFPGPLALRLARSVQERTEGDDGVGEWLERQLGGNGDPYWCLHTPMPRAYWTGCCSSMTAGYRYCGHNSYVMCGARLWPPSRWSLPGPWTIRRERQWTPRSRSTLLRTLRGPHRAASGYPLTGLSGRAGLSRTQFVSPSDQRPRAGEPPDQRPRLSTLAGACCRIPSWCAHKIDVTTTVSTPTRAVASVWAVPHGCSDQGRRAGCSVGFASRGRGFADSLLTGARCS